MTDYVGQWFKIYRELNEPTDIIFKVNEEIVLFPHEKGDGTAALFEISRLKKWNITNAAINKAKPLKKLRFIFNCLLFLYRTRPQKNIWPFEIQKISKHNHPVYETCSFTEAETESLLSKAANSKISLNAILLHSFSDILDNKIIKIGGFQIGSRKLWWIPVNMRSEFNLDTNDRRHEKNYVSNITIDTTKAMKPLDYHKLISAGLKQQQHWATWWWQLIGRFLSYKLIKFVAKKNLLDQNYIGVLSNLGIWDSPESKDNVSFIIPPLRSHPVGVSAIIWNKRLNLGISLYPSFPFTKEQLEELIKIWKTNLLRSDL